MICRPGYALMDNNRCSTCTELTNCQSCTNSSGNYNCTSCPSGYGRRRALFSWPTLVVYTRCYPCDDVNCAYCSTFSDNCTSCKSGFQLSSGNCYPCSVSRCISCYSNTNLCTSCQTGFTVAPIFGDCVPCSFQIPGCLRCSQSNTTSKVCY